jgi:hypothetical protein
MLANPELIRRLRHCIRGLEQPRTARGNRLISSGAGALDRLLPGGGLRRGWLVEWLAGGEGSGAAALALRGARQACGEGGALLVVDRARQIYPPALAGWGIDLEQVVLVQPRDAREEAWVWDQALRCPAVAAIWGWADQIDERSFRRLQLSAEASGAIGMLLRPLRVRSQPSWADVRLLVEPRPAQSGRRMRVELLYCRGAGGRGAVELEWDEWSGQLREGRGHHETRLGIVAAPMASAKTGRRPAGIASVRGRAV